MAALHAGGIAAAAIFLCKRVRLSRTQQVVFPLSFCRRPITALTLACASLPIQGFRVVNRSVTIDCRDGVQDGTLTLLADSHIVTKKRKTK